MITKIRKAVIPVAGMGTRFLPATKAQPKEMLTLVDKPIIQYIVEEAVAAGIEEIIFVTSLGKRAIEDHFDRNFELEYRLRKKGRKKELGEILDITDMAKFVYVRQRSPNGDGDALLSAEHVVGDEPCAVLFGDDIIDAKKPALAQLIEVWNRYEDPVVGLYRLPKKELFSYGVARAKPAGERTVEVTGFVEKPTPSAAPSNLAAVGRYIITPEIFDVLGRLKPGPGGEIRLADAFVEFLRFRSMYGAVIEGARYDCGSKLGFLKAQIAFGLKHAEVGREFKKYLTTKSKKQ
jgi:UTP--glucose-1-phosphate uridylyltransferase